MDIKYHSRPLREAATTAKPLVSLSALSSFPPCGGAFSPTLFVPYIEDSATHNPVLFKPSLLRRLLQLLCARDKGFAKPWMPPPPPPSLYNSTNLFLNSLLCLFIFQSFLHPVVRLSWEQPPLPGSNQVFTPVRLTGTRLSMFGHLDHKHAGKANQGPAPPPSPGKGKI